MNEDLAGLDLVQLLDLLVPVPEPPVILLWPETEAWGWGGLVLVAIGLLLIRRWLQHRRANAYRRAALREIAAARQSPVVLAEILRRTALVAFPRSEVAGLYGDDWLAFLDRTTRGEGEVFRRGAGRAFARIPYAREVGETEALASLAIAWIRHHERDSGAAP